MKKALLTLTMVCALPISSLNAGLSDWMPSAWKKEASAETKQAHADSAKGYGLGAALALGSTALFLAATIATSPNKPLGSKNGPILQFRKSDALWILNPINASLAVLFRAGCGGDILQMGAALGLLASEVTALYCAAKTIYNGIQSERIQTKDES